MNGAKHFVYNGVSSEEMNVMLCRFDSSGKEDVSAGSLLELKNSKTFGMNHWDFYNSSYKEPLSFTIQIKKISNTPFTLQEQANITQWICCKDGYKPFQFDDWDYDKVIFYSFCQELLFINIGGQIIGAQANFVCNAPFAFSPIQHKIFLSNTTNLFYVLSDEIGFLYPKFTIEIIKDCDVQIINESESKRVTEIQHCIAGETIILDNQLKIIQSDKTHDFANDFNFVWFRLVKLNYKHTKNEISVIGDCKVTMTYQFIRKIGVG